MDGHKLVRGRKRHILVDMLGLPIASRVEPANMPDQKAGARLLGGLRAFFPAIRTVMADASHESRKLARHLLQHKGWKLVITRRDQRAFEIKGLTWIVERSLAWIGRNRRFSKDYEFKVQTSETMIDIAAIRLMPNRIEPAKASRTTSEGCPLDVASTICALNRSAHHDFARPVQADNGRRQHLAQSVRHQLDPVSPDGNKGVGGAEVDADDHTKLLYASSR